MWYSSHLWVMGGCLLFSLSHPCCPSQCPAHGIYLIFSQLLRNSKNGVWPLEKFLWVSFLWLCIQNYLYIWDFIVETDILLLTSPHHSLLSLGNLLRVCKIQHLRAIFLGLTLIQLLPEVPQEQPSNPVTSRCWGINSHCFCFTSEITEVVLYYFLKFFNEIEFL